MSKSSRLQAFSFSHILTGVSAAAILFAAALLLSSVFTRSAFADELTGDKTVTVGTNDWNKNYSNSSEDQYTITLNGFPGDANTTYSGAISGNIAVVVDLPESTHNNNRIIFTSANNDFTGGLTINNGIYHRQTNNSLSCCKNGLTLNNAVFMGYGDCDFGLTISDNAYGGLRASGGNIVLNQKVTGSGDLVIVTENSGKVTLNGANDYAGVTSIGTVQGGNNVYAYLILGADNTLPSTTVVEIGKSQNSKYSFSTASAANLDLNGKTQSIAGLYGAGKATITNGTAAAANLTIDLAESKSYEYSGTIAGNSATNLTNLTVTGAGNQTLSGNISNASLTKEGTGTLTLGADSVSLSSLAVTEGTLAFTPNVNLTVSGNVTSTSALDLNGANLTYTSNAATDFNNVNIGNTNTETQSILTIAPTADVSQPTFNKSISGNTRLIVKLYSNENNNSRLVLSGTNDFTGGLYIEQGTVKVENTSSLGSNKQIDIKNGCLMTNKTFADYTINLIGDPAAGERGAIRLMDSGNNFDAYITGEGSFEIVTDGTVTLTNQANNYQGKTYIGNYQWRSSTNAATLKLGKDEVLPNSTIVVFGKDASGGGTTGAIKLDLNGHNETVAGISSQSTNASITSSSDATLTIKANDDFSYAGTITASTKLEKEGIGTLTLSGANTYSGGTTISGGTLVLSGSGTLGTGDVANNGTLEFANTSNQTFSAVISGSGDIKKTGTGEVTLSSSNAISFSNLTVSNGVLVLKTSIQSGNVDIQAGELVYAKGDALLNASSVTIAQGAKLTLKDLGTSNASINNSVANNGTITVSSGRLRTFGISGDGTIVMDGGTIMNYGRSDTAETIISNNLTIETGKTGTFDVGWAKNSTFPSKLQFNGSLSGAGDFILATNSNAPSALSQIAPLVANFSSSDFTGNVITNSGYNMLVMGKENAFGESVGTLQDNGWVDLNGYNQTFAGLTGKGNLINRGSADATITLNVPEGETSKFEGAIYGIANQSNGKSYNNISVKKTGEGTFQIYAAQGAVDAYSFIISSGRLDMKEYFTGTLEVGENLGNGSYTTAIFSPGNSVGTLTVDGDYTLNPGSTLLIEIGKDDQGNVVADKLIVNGPATFEPGSIIDIVLDDASSLVGGETFEGVIITADNAADIFNDVKAAIRSYYFDITVTQSGNDISLTARLDPNAVPEPSTWALLILGAAGLLYFRKRK